MPITCSEVAAWSSHARNNGTLPSMHLRLDASLREQSYAIVDIESTGIDPARDRILEVAVVQLSVGDIPKLVFDSLVNPEQAVRWTELHGLVDWDVAGAPTFREVAPSLRSVLAGRIVVAHNAEFDLAMLGSAFTRGGSFVGMPPHLCTLRLAKTFCDAPSYTLGSLCEATGVEHREEHSARGDALALAELFSGFVVAMESVGLKSASALVAFSQENGDRFPFVSSFENPTIHPPQSERRCRLLPRRGVGRTYRGHLALRAYRDEVLGAVHDLQVTDEELERVRSLRKELGLSDTQANAMHARVFSEYLGRFLADDKIEHDEKAALHRLASCLRTLGWTPGDDAA